MPYDEGLAQRVREIIEEQIGFNEKKMFGGVCYLLNGNMACGILNENAIQFFDPDHSDDEDRFILIGVSFKLKVLVVCHCFRESDTVIRIISARKADGDEEHEYWRNRR